MQAITLSTTAPATGLDVYVEYTFQSLSPGHWLVFLIIGFTLFMTGCQGEKQDAVETKSYQYDGILRHMRGHTDQIELLNNALANHNIDDSKLPVRWLQRHDTIVDVPVDLQSYLAAMREAARAAESATDFETASAASSRIAEQCQGCHDAVGISGV